MPVRVVAAGPTTLTLRLKATDCPRFLQVTETRAGPLILAPRAELDQQGRVRVSWRTNVRAACSLTYGVGWENRGANPLVVKPKRGRYAVTLPAQDAATPPGVVAVRIHASARGLTNVWPRWDEDPAGQVVVTKAATTGNPPGKAEKQ